MITEEQAATSPIPGGGRWGVDVRPGVQLRHWIPPGSLPQLPALGRGTYRAPDPCRLLVWMVAESERYHWTSWPRCEACKQAYEQHRAERLHDAGDSGSR